VETGFYDEQAVGREVLQAGPLEVRPQEHLALAAGHPLPLTVRELQLLTALARRANQVVNRADLYGSVWQGPFRASDRSVDVYVSKLRAKLEVALPRWRYIHTHFGFGYRFSPCLYTIFTARSHSGNRLRQPR
jgi:DNA-binding response OmpR family regulator